MKRILATFTFMALNSGCGGNNCEMDAENYRPRECAIKVESRDFTWRWFSITGTNATKNDVTRNTIWVAGTLHLRITLQSVIL